MKKLIEKVLGNKFNLDEFLLFTKDFFKKDDITTRKIMIDNRFSEFIKEFSFLGDYTDQENKNIEILAVELIGDTKVERARSFQRELIAKYLKDNSKDSAFVAFYSDNPDWRLSFVKMEYKLTEKGAKTEVVTPPKRYSFLVGETEPSYTAKKQLLNILDDKDNPLVSEIEDAFSVEKVTKEFYEKYRGLFDSLAKNLKKNKSFQIIAIKEKIDTDNFAKKLLGQIVFLYFLQKKGWLGVSENKKWGQGDKYFLRTLLNNAKKEKKNFYNDCLEHLFYDTLNNPRRNSVDQSYSNYFKCRIPFLNGGLFEPSYDWKNTTIYLEDSIFNEILEVFDLYNFTVKEDEPLEKEVAVDPEMLGKVFENLLSENIRKGQGAYYTPREIVHYMCQESLINHLNTETQIDIESIRKLVTFKEEKLTDKEKGLLDSALATIKVCDPACGSGAFLVGMLNEIIGARRILTDKKEYPLKKETIQNCIYGVDIDPGAVDIAKLRLWLSLVVDHELNEIEPLPNLDCKIMCGNSLLEELIIGDESIKLFDERLVDSKNKRLFEGEYEGKIIKDEKHEYLKNQLEGKGKFLLEEKIKKVDDIIKNLNPQKTEDRKRLSELQKKKIEYMDIPDKIREDKVRPYFLWKLNFYEVFKEKDGFDVVIANPPYGIVFEQQIKKRYELDYESFKRNNDIYVSFYEKGIRLMAKNGILVYISPNTYLNGDYFKKLREFLISRIRIIEIIDFKEFPVFEDPTVCVSILTCVNTSSRKFPYKFELKISKNMLGEYESNTIVVSGISDAKLKPSNAISDKIKQLKSVSVLDEYFYIKDVGFNYWTEGKGKKRDGNSVGDRILYEGIRKNEKDIGFIKGRDISKYHIKPIHNYLKFDYDKYLDKKDTFRFSEEFFKCKPKIVYRQTAYNIIATMDYDCRYLDKTVHIIVPKDNGKIFDMKYVLALLNTKLYSYLYAYISQEREGRAFAQVKTVYIKQLPIVKTNNDNTIIEFVDKILDITKDHNYLNDIAKQSKVKEYEHQIDQMVYKLYGLNNQEIKIIEDLNN